VQKIAGKRKTEHDRDDREVSAERGKDEWELSAASSIDLSNCH
jgi:hypothetical protein